MKVLAAHSHLTLCDPTDCSMSGYSVHGILQARILEGGHSLLQGIFLIQGSNSALLHCRLILVSFFTCSCPVFPAPLIEKTVFSLYILVSVAID